MKSWGNLSQPASSHCHRDSKGIIIIITSSIQIRINMGNTETRWQTKQETWMWNFDPSGSWSGRKGPGWHWHLAKLLVQLVASLKTALQLDDSWKVKQLLHQLLIAAVTSLFKDSCTTQLLQDGGADSDRISLLLCAQPGQAGILHSSCDLCPKVLLARLGSSQRRQKVLKLILSWSCPHKCLQGKEYNITHKLIV